MGNFTMKLFGDEREWNAMEARADANPYERYLQKVRASLNADVKKKL